MLELYPICGIRVYVRSLNTARNTTLNVLLWKSLWLQCTRPANWGKIFCTNGEQAELRKNGASPVKVDVCHNLLHCTSFYAIHIRHKWWSEPHICNTLYCTPPPLLRSPYSTVGIATRYGLDGPGIESWWGTRFSAPVQTGPGAHPASYTMGHSRE
jgi:hypothetical protein